MVISMMLHSSMPTFEKVYRGLGAFLQMMLFAKQVQSAAKVRLGAEVVLSCVQLYIFIECLTDFC